MIKLTRRQTQRIWLIIAFAFVLLIGNYYPPQNEQPRSLDAPLTAEQLFADEQSRVQLQVDGTVIRLLPDRPRHQRFVIELESGHTLLIAHNTELAPRIDSLKPGDSVSIYGRYEWNEEGGVVHWTHHDPANIHPHGWIRHQGQLYQ
ncbi:MAG: DUF3465 domain-containing protein [Methylophaga sp.]|nr:DUF3465 domain-containing protein [Methylophaga sp.]